jgi:N-acetylglutamate synthase-like GNAT family acetyltransferase
MTGVMLRSAGIADVEAMHRLINENLEAGHLLPRTAVDIAQHAPRFIVAESNNEVVGCAELAPLSDSVAEVRSLVVDERYRGQRIGTELVHQLAGAATANGFGTLCAFTHEPSHFVGMGFTMVPHIWLPEKITHDCTSCALFRRCGQYAVILPLRAGMTIRPEAPAVVLHGARPAAERRPPIKRLHLRPAAAERVDQHETVTA